MAKRITNTTLNATTMDIMNVIRANASYDYQQNVPVVTQATDIPAVGQIIYGTPAFANQFINALINRIAIVRVNSATFNNPYSQLKKGYLEFGETIEDIFVNIAQAVDFDVEKAEKREFKRTLPDVKSAYYVMNWRVMYPITIQDDDLKTAFLSMEGVQNLIAKIVDSVYTAAEYDEFLLFKYLLIKAISSGKMYPISIGAGTDMSEAAVNFRGTSNLLPFMKSTYNEIGVLTTTPKSRQIIFMDAMYNAAYDVNVLASAFNMDKADFMGRLYLIDDFTTFDNNRFDIIRENSTGLEEVTSAELALLQNVKAVLIDSEWFQVYDNHNKFTEKYVASGLYWNYFYHVWKTLAHSPFANAVVFVTSAADTELPTSITMTITGKDISAEAVTLNIQAIGSTPSLSPSDIKLVQTNSLTAAGIAVQPWGGLIIPKAQFDTDITLVAQIGQKQYTATSAITSSSKVEDTITLSDGTEPEEPEEPEEPTK